jgi:hypothetical protein
MNQLVKAISSITLDLADSNVKYQKETDKFVSNYDKEFPDINAEKSNRKRDAWGKEIEFLLSCIAMSVGLGNYWNT